MDVSIGRALVLSFLLLFYDAVCQKQHDCTRSRFPTYVCKKWNECAEGKMMIEQRKAILCGFENSFPKLCCPPVTPSRTIPNSRENAVAIVQKKCDEYSAYRLANDTIPGPLIGDLDATHVTIRDCVSAEPVLVEGTFATPKEFPHMALIGYGDSLDSVQWLCGGSLISERFVMSAAHCSISGSYGEAKWALLGDLNITSQTDDARPKIYRIIRRIDHPNYKRNSAYNDITLFQLNSTVEFSPFVRPICLYTPTVLPAGVNKLTVTGWGSTGTIERRSEHLSKASVSVSDSERCLSTYKHDNSLDHGFDSESMICVGETIQGKTPCLGDAGGPLQLPVKDTDCIWTQVGIISYGPTFCEDKETPSIYTRVTNFIEWIQLIVWPETVV